LDGQIPAIAKAIDGLPAQNACFDGDLCGVLADGRTAFNLIQNASDKGGGSLVFFRFDLLFLDGEDIRDLPVVDRKTRLASLLRSADRLQYNDHQIGQAALGRRALRESALEDRPCDPYDALSHSDGLSRVDPLQPGFLRTTCEAQPLRSK
jgi:bifunctional non-homologous end joining protein LigD